MNSRFTTSLSSGRARISRMSKKHMSQVWVSWETYRRLLTVRGELQRRDGKIRNINEAIGELIASWKEYSKVSEKAAGKPQVSFLNPS